MLKPQDIVLLIKLLASLDHLIWPQSKLAQHLCLSVSVINTSLKRLKKSGLLMQPGVNGKLYQPIIAACRECLISGVKYFFPAHLGEYTRGIATCYAAPIFKNKIVMGNDPIPVWPYAEGSQRGVAFAPLYPSIPKSVAQYPDKAFYELLVLVDTLRYGRARERTIAVELLKEKLNDDIKESLILSNDG